MNAEIWIIPRTQAMMFGLAFAFVLCAAAAFALTLPVLGTCVAWQQERVSPVAVSAQQDANGSARTIFGITGIVVAVRATAASISKEIPDGQIVVAALRALLFHARRLAGFPDDPVILPSINLLGDRSLASISLIQAANAVVLDITARCASVQLLNEVLVFRITSHLLALHRILREAILTLPRLCLPKCRHNTLLIYQDNPALALSESFRARKA